MGKQEIDNKTIVESTRKRSGNHNSVAMSISEKDPEKAKLKADLFNKLYQLQSKRGIAKFNSTEEMQMLIESYFADCAEIGIRPTIRGLASALGTTYNTLNDWENGSRDGQLGSSCSVVVKKAKQFIAEYDELMAMEGLDNPILFMFRAKNYYGMSDKQEISVSNGNTALGDTLTPEEIRRSITHKQQEQLTDNDLDSI